MKENKRAEVVFLALLQGIIPMPSGWERSGYDGLIGWEAIEAPELGRATRSHSDSAGMLSKPTSRIDIPAAMVASLAQRHPEVIQALEAGIVALLDKIERGGALQRMRYRDDRQVAVAEGQEAIQLLRRETAGEEVLPENGWWEISYYTPSGDISSPETRRDLGTLEYYVRCLTAWKA